MIIKIRCRLDKYRASLGYIVSGNHRNLRIQIHPFRRDFDAFYLQYGDFEGSLFDAKAALEYNIWDHVGVGVGYDYFRLNIKSQGSKYPGIDLMGQIQFNYGGLLLYGKYFF